MSDRTPRNGNTVSKTIRDDFSRSLKTQIQRSGIKQGDLARRVGMSEQAMSTVLNGHSFPTRYLDRICEELGVRVVLYADNREILELKAQRDELLAMFEEVVALGNHGDVNNSIKFKALAVRAAEERLDRFKKKHNHETSTKP